MQLLSAFLVTILCLVPSFALADSTRCFNTKKIINDGMSQYEVESKCGAPTSRQDLTSSAVSKDGVVVSGLKIEEWTYDFGPQAFIQKLRFEGGVLKSIESGERGSKKIG